MCFPWWANCSVKSWSGRLSRRRAWWGVPRHRAERWLFLQALAWGLWLSVLTRFRWSTLTGFVERQAGGSRAAAGPPPDLERWVACVEAALAFGGPLVRPGCLVRGLTLFLLLRRAGVPVSLCFGIPRRDGAWTTEAGHCWLEREGEPWAERKDPRPSFHALQRLPAVREPAAGPGAVEAATVEAGGRAAGRRRGFHG